MTIEHFIKRMAEEKWVPNDWKPEALAGIPPNQYDVEFKGEHDKIIMIKGQTIMSMSSEYFPEWIKDTNREAYKSSFIQIF